jgi:hypothetical protein
VTNIQFCILKNTRVWAHKKSSDEYHYDRDFESRITTKPATYTLNDVLFLPRAVTAKFTIDYKSTVLDICSTKLGWPELVVDNCIGFKLPQEEPRYDFFVVNFQFVKWKTTFKNEIQNIALDNKIVSNYS